MGKFEQEAKDLLAAIGGKENVTAVTHCATRMRFVLGDDKKAYTHLSVFVLDYTLSQLHATVSF